MFLGFAAGAALWGYLLLSSGNSPAVTLPASQSLSLNPPAVYMYAAADLKAVVTRAVLQNENLDISLSISAPGNSKPQNLTVLVWPAHAYPDDGWKGVSTSGISGAEITLRVTGSTPGRMLPSLSLDCSCYVYHAPYLLASGVSVVDVIAPGSGLPNIPGEYPGPGPGGEQPVGLNIDQDVLDLSNLDIGGGVFTLSASPYFDVQQIGTDVWQWQDPAPSGAPYFEAESVAAKNSADQHTFVAGLLLGVAASAVIVSIDRGFDMWNDRRERREQRSKARQEARPSRARRAHNPPYS